jgi:hypothetical protein
LPATVDGDGDYVVIIATTLKNGATGVLPYYATFSEGTSFCFRPLSNSDIGTITIQIMIADDNHFPTSYTVLYTFKVTVIAQIVKIFPSTNTSSGEVTLN